MPPDAPAAKPSAAKPSEAKPSAAKPSEAKPSDSRPKDANAPAATSGAAKATKAKRCPVCGKPAVEASRPFCSERCRDVDLNRWLSGAYTIPAAPSTDDED